MADILTPDLCIIGAGAGGLSVAAGAAALGVPVVLIEKGEMGGECLNVGCVPSKALLAAAHRAENMRMATPFGIAAVRPRIDFAQVQAHVRSVIEAIAPNDSAERFTAMGVQVIKGTARFSDRKTISVGSVTIRARRFVLATGSRPVVPDVPGLRDGPVLTNETIFDLSVLPEKLLILGGGPIGFEMAQAFRRLGSEVTIVEAGRALGRIDPEIVGHAIAALRREGVTILEQARLVRVEHRPDGARVFLEGKSEPLEATHILVAAGRAPTVESLGLEEAGVRYDRTGILVDAGLRTSNKRVFAIGDCAGGPNTGDRLTHVANDHAGIVLRRALFRLPAKVSRAATPAAIYTDPEIATVGLSEDEAARTHRSIRVLRWAFCENDRAQAERQEAGEIKVVTTARGKILGAAIVGAHAGELILPWVLAVKKGLPISDMRDLIVPYPTYSEVSRRAAFTFYAGAARSPAARRLIRVLRFFG